MLPKCLIKSFTCKICISYRINLISQFSIRTLTFSFIHFLTFTLLVNNTPYKKNLMTCIMPFFRVVWQCSWGGSIFIRVYSPLEKLHLSTYGVFTFVEHNSFGNNKCIDQNNPWLFKMLFVKCSHTFQPTFCNNAKLKWKQKIPYQLLILKFCLFEYLKTFLLKKLLKTFNFIAWMLLVLFVFKASGFGLVALGLNFAFLWPFGGYLVISLIYLVATMSW
jgi:hypothetical protein